MNTSIIKNTVRIKEPANLGIIVSALQVVQACFRIEVVPPVAEWVCICHCAGSGKDVAPAVVGVLRYDIAIGSIGYGNNIPLQISCVDICFRSVIEPYKHTAFVVEEVQAAVACFLPKQLRAVPIILRGNAVNGFTGAQPGFVVSIFVLKISLITLLKNFIFKSSLKYYSEPQQYEQFYLLFVHYKSLQVIFQ